MAAKLREYVANPALVDEHGRLGQQAIFKHHSRGANGRRASVALSSAACTGGCRALRCRFCRLYRRHIRDVGTDIRAFNRAIMRNLRIVPIPEWIKSFVADLGQGP